MYDQVDVDKDRLLYYSDTNQQRYFEHSHRENKNVTNKV